MQIILKNAVKVNLFSQYSMACQHHSFPSCFSGIAMFEDFSTAITYFNNVSLYIGRETTSEVCNLWVSPYNEWNFLLSFSDSNYKINVKLKRVTTIERYERWPSTLLWINNGTITSQNHQVPNCFSYWNCFLFVSDCVTVPLMKRMVVNVTFAIFENFRSVSSMGCKWWIEKMEKWLVAH